MDDSSKVKKSICNKLGLIAVIVVIIGLAFVMFVLLTRPRETARPLSPSNLRQLGKALQIYNDSYDARPE